MNIEKVKNSIRNVPDFPKTGIQFKDITTLLLDNEIFCEVIDCFNNQFKNQKIDVIAGIESRGFIFAAPLAIKLKCKFALIRKPGKLPSESISEEYELEYGTDSIEIHTDAINVGDKVLIVDDLLATGGTAQAAGLIVNKLGGIIVSYAFLIELVTLNGKAKLGSEPIMSIVKY